MLKKLSALIPAIIISIGLFGFIWLFFSLIAVKEKNIDSVLENEKAVVERVVSDNFNHTFAIAESMNSQIKNNVGNKKYINEILTKYKTSPNLVDAFSWTIFSWVDKKNQLIVDAKYSILKTPIDLSDRDYLKFRSKTNELVIGRPVIGSTSKKWMIPAGVSLLDKNKQYLGAMTIGFDIDVLAKIIQKSIRNDNIKFVLFLDQVPILEVRKSSFRSFRNNESLETEPNLAKFAEMKDVQEVKVLLNPRAFHVVKFKEYPSLKIVAEYDSPAIKKELWSALSRILEGLFIISTFGTLLFLLYRKEKLQSKIFLNLKNIAEKANQAKESLIKSISHDIRNQISRITNLSEVLVDEFSDAKKGKTKEHLKNLKLIHLESKELLFFVEDLLDNTQTKSGKFTLGIKSKVDITEFIKGLVDFNKVFFAQEKVTVKLEIAEDLPFLFCDRRRLKQIISNLLSNAAKYSNENGVVKITAKHLKDSGQMLIEISDQGIGMNEEQIEMALSGQGKNIEKLNLNKEIDSHGIGLPIVQHLTELHDGKLEIESIKGVGTTFRLFFPLNVEVFDVANAIEERTINVLIVDDQEVNLLMTRFLLEKEIKNIVCKVSKSADEALEVIKEQNKSDVKFDLILTDIQMPKIDGFELAKMIRKADQEIPIIAYSSTISDINTERFHPEISQFLSKPIKNYLLVKAVKKWTLRKEEKQELTEEELEIVKGKTILFADDEKLNQMLMIKALEEYQINVKAVNNGKELLEEYKNNKNFDLIISDVKMPIIDGLKATKEIRDEEIKNNLYHQMPIITYSGNSDKDSIYEAFRAGADDYYIKGEAKEKLIKMIAFWLKASQQNNSITPKTKDEETVKSEIKQKNPNEFFDDELIKIFIRDSKRLILEMKQANEVKDLKRLSFASHALKGICGVAKVDELFKHVSYINDIVKNNALVDEEDLAKTNDLLEKTVLELRQKISVRF